MIGVRFLLAVACMFMLSACPEKPMGTPVTTKEPLVGKWESSSRTFEVFEDGTITYTDKIKKEPTTGSYEFVNNVVFRVKHSALGTHDYKAYINENKLLLTSIDGKLYLEYTKVKELSKE